MVQLRSITLKFAKEFICFGKNRLILAFAKIDRLAELVQTYDYFCFNYKTSVKKLSFKKNI